MKPFKIDKQTVFHRYLICPSKVSKTKNQSRRSQDIMMTDSEYGNSSGSTIHMCRLIQLEDPNILNWPLCIMKRVGFSYKDLKRGANSFAAISNIRKIDQIRTEFLVFNLMANSKRCIKLYDLLTENTRREEDQNFFYKYLGIKKNPGIENACLILEYCNGGDLEKMIQTMDRPLTQNEIIHYACQILEGLNELKKKGVLHRDLRPCNIFLHNGQIKFADFDSAYIYKLSSLSDVSSGIDIDTTPPEIVELASKSEEELKQIGNEKIYNTQSKCDIYFFGMILFKMIFQKNYYKTYEGATLDYLIKEKISQGFSPSLLEVMKESLHWSVDKRIDLKTLNTILTEIERKNYFQPNSKPHQVFLSPDYLALTEAPEETTQKEEEQEDRQKMDEINYLDMETEFQQGLTKSYRSRFSEIYKYKLQNYIGDNRAKRYSEQSLHLWQENPKIQFEKKKFTDMAENFVKKLSIRGYFYDYLYKVILRIDMRSIKSKQHRQVMKENKYKIERELVVALMFIFQILGRTPFKRDKHYDDVNLTYEVRKLFLSLVKINNKALFFESRTKILECKDTSFLYQIIQKFYQIQYTEEQEIVFEPIQNTVMHVIDQIEEKIKEMLIQTSIDLIESYQNKSNEKINLRQILLVLVIFSQQDLEKMDKPSIVMLRKYTEPLIYRQKIVSQEVESFFESFKKKHDKVNEKSERKLNSFKKINSYKNFLPGIPSAKVMEEEDLNIDYNIKISPV